MIITKDIYLIRNNVNDKVYIGQAKNTLQRFKTHCRPSEKSTYFDRAINKIGPEHFWYEILEEQIENYDEREEYWIEYYDCTFPKGYNIAKGGNGTEAGIYNISSIIKDEKTLLNIIDDLKNTKMEYKEISDKYNLNNEVLICRINTGACYRQKEIDYPIRKERADALISEQQVKEIKELLRASCLSFSEISEKYNISNFYLRDINTGKLKKDENENYPIRTGVIRKNCLTDEELDEICNLLINTNLSINKISKMYNRDRSVIEGIKNGTTKIYRREKYTYPLRPNNFKKPVSTISAKESTATIDT